MAYSTLSQHRKRSFADLLSSSSGEEETDAQRLQREERMRLVMANMSSSSDDSSSDDSSSDDSSRNSDTRDSDIRDSDIRDPDTSASDIRDPGDSDKSHNYRTDLQTKGFAIIPGVLGTFELAEAIGSFRDTKPTITDAPPHGIHQHWQAGHSRHSWLIRTNPQVLRVWRDILAADRLIVSFDGYCHIDKSDCRKDTSWVHTDQSPARGQFAGYQGFVSLTDNSERTFVCYEGSHLQHYQYFADRDFKNNTKHFTRDFHKIDKAYLSANLHRRKVLTVKAGDMVVWDSRTFHQNQYGKPNSEERLVQYVSYQNRQSKANTTANQNKRLKYFNARRTTSHWAAPVRVNGLQPQVFGDKSKLIVYSELAPPNLNNIDCLSLV